MHTLHAYSIPDDSVPADAPTYVLTYQIARLKVLI